MIVLPVGKQDDLTLSNAHHLHLVYTCIGMQNLERSYVFLYVHVIVYAKLIT